jgi:acyl carrier protein
MDSRTIEEQIRECIMRQSPLARSRGVRDDEPLLQNGILDSMGILDLVGYLEDEFGIVVEDEELSPDNFQTIQRLAVFVSGKRNP